MSIAAKPVARAVLFGLSVFLLGTTQSGMAQTPPSATKPSSTGTTSAGVSTPEQREQFLKSMSGIFDRWTPSDQGGVGVKDGFATLADTTPFVAKVTKNLPDGSEFTMVVSGNGTIDKPSGVSVTITFNLLANAKPQVVVKGDVLRFDGEVTPKNAADIVRGLGQGVRHMIVTSEGGDAVAGLAIGKEVHKRKISVHVEKYCLSACANYVFLAASKKSLGNGAVLGFHGGITGSASRSAEEQAKAKEIVNSGPAIPGLNEMLRSLEDLGKETSELYRTLGFNDGLIRRSFELTKLPEPTLTFEFKAEGKTYTYQNQEAAAQKLYEFSRDGTLYTFTYTSTPTAAQKAYFPSLTVLRSYGVTGIDEYAYPANQAKLDLIAHAISDDLTVVGDF